MKPLQPYHYAWLSVHPKRSEDWLRARFADGFYIHHVDGDHENDDPMNLILLEKLDHLRLHATKADGGRLLPYPQRRMPGKRASKAKELELVEPTAPSAPPPQVTFAPRVTRADRQSERIIARHEQRVREGFYGHAANG